MVNHVSFGVSEVDRLMGGGLLPGNCYLMEVEPGTEEMVFIAAFLNEGLRHGDFCTLILYDRPHEDVINGLKRLGVNVSEALDSGSMIIADLYSEGEYDPERRGPILTTDNPGDPNSALRIYYDLDETNEMKLKSGKFAGTRSVLFSLSSKIMSFKFEPAYKLVKQGLRVVRQHNGLSLNVLNPRMFDETVVAAFEHLYDGVIMLTIKEAKRGFQRFIRVKVSPIFGFYTDEVPYDTTEGKPRLVTPFTEPIPDFRDHLKFNVDGTIILTGSRFVLVNGVVLTSFIEELVKMIGYETVTDAIYVRFKVNIQNELKGILSSMNIKLGDFDPKKLLELLVGYLSTSGLGMTELVRFTDSLITFRVRNSLCSLSKDFSRPMGPYLSGVFAGVLEFLLGKPIRCVETKCVAKGDEYCEFTCEKTS
nr:V4R domain-containing protein [Candidatus Njordarchaeota archaeon]